ncbi:MAG: cysteine--tRNA ligase [Dehalococcoidia bacterium]
MKLYDTLTAKKREFSPAGEQVKLYVCGVTPYGLCHIGHALSYVFFDVLRRYLEFQGYTVDHVQNFTDIDDKIIQRAAELDVPPEELAQRHIDEYFVNMDALHVKRARLYPRATQEIPGMVEVIRALVDKGYAYSVDGSVYFRVRKADGYGRLSHRTLEGMMAGARVAEVPGKEDPLDFALWKAAKPGEPFWESPWGRGRPGWHIECTTMSLLHLGETLDIHGGGQDLIFPHHENEIVQSEAYTEVRPFARFWVHNGLLQLGEKKMSRSLGNLITVRDALRRYCSDALRLFFLNAHYRSPLVFGEDALAASERAAERLRNALREGPSSVEGGLDPHPYRQSFLQAMDDDLNTPQALAVLFDLAREINRSREAGQGVGEAQEMLRQLGDLLGLTFQERRAGEALSPDSFIELLVATRAELRAAGQYALADQVRARLSELGVVLEDGPEGTQWRFHSP